MTIPIRRPPQFGPSATPFGLVRAKGGLRVARKARLITLSRYVEEQADNHLDPPIVLATFQRPEFFTPATARRYRKLAATCPAVVLLGASPVVDPAVHCAAIDPADPLADEWVVVVVGAHYAAALIACDLGDSGPDRDRRFEYLLTHDREVVVTAGQMLLSRLA